MNSTSLFVPWGTVITFLTDIGGGYHYAPFLAVYATPHTCAFDTLLRPVKNKIKSGRHVIITEYSR